MRRFISLAFVPALLVGPLYAAADGSVAQFTQRPTAKKATEGVRIDFAVSKPTDVTVYIEDAGGQIVRHLAAGVLGRNAPAPLKADSLEQSLVWDGKDDDGLPARPTGDGRLQVRVALGLKANYAGTAFSEQTGPNNISNVWGLAAGNGRVYVVANRWGKLFWLASAVHVFRRDGAYEKTIKPFPANLPPERLAGTGAFRGQDGRLIPIIHHPLDMTFYPFADIPHQPTVTPDGHLLLAVVPPQFVSSTSQKISAHLATLDGDGGLPLPNYAGPALGELFSPANPPCLATGTGGKCVYLTGLGPKLKGVSRVKLPDRGPAEPFFADIEAPKGLACDSAGHLFIGDPANNQVVVINEADKTVAGKIPVAEPTWVGVHPKTGAVYVRGREGLLKFSGFREPKELARLALPPIPKDTRARPAKESLALDASADPPVIWLGYSMGGDPLKRCEDRGEKFTDLAPAGCYASPFLWNISVDPLRSQVSYRVSGWYDHSLRILDDATGQSRLVKNNAKGTHSTGWIYRLGRGGERIYVMDVTGPIQQMDKTGRLVPFPATTQLDDKMLKGTLANAYTGHSGWTRDFSVDRRGNLHVQTPLTAPDDCRPATRRHSIYSPDGRLLRTGIVVCTRAAYGPRVDNAGNIYLADVVKRADQVVPADLKDKLPPPGAGLDKPAYWYDRMYGSYMKFGPDGGGIGMAGKSGNYAFADELARLGPPSKDECAPNIADVKLSKPVLLHGLQWRWFGFSHMAPNDTHGDDHCQCMAQEFDVDDFGRSFIPDQARFRVVVLDTAGNEIGSFGGYGNQDACGPDSYVLDAEGKYHRPRRPDDAKELSSAAAQPEIAIGWLCGLGVSDRYAYLADAINRRVLRVKLTYLAEATCPVQ